MSKHNETFAAIAQMTVNVDEGQGGPIMKGSRVDEAMRELIANPVYAAAPELFVELEKSANVIAHCISEMPEAYREAMRTQLRSARTAIIKAAAEIVTA